MALKTYPLNDMDYEAADAELFHCTRSSGIYAGDDFQYSITGADNLITIDVGLGWIRNSRFSGKAVALKAAETLDLGISDATYPRIDAVVIQFDVNRNGTQIVVKQGTAASAPVAPEVVQTEALYELHLYQIRRGAGSVAVTAADITDLRLNKSYCGLMACAVTSIDTSAIDAQATALLERLRTELASVEDGSGYLLKSGGVPTPENPDQAANKEYVDSLRKLVLITLPASGWVGNAQTVDVPGVIADEENCHPRPSPASASHAVFYDCDVHGIAQLDGKITFGCEEVPAVDLTVFVEILFGRMTVV